MSQFVTSITFTVLHAGADPFSGDDFYTVINGKHNFHPDAPPPKQTGGSLLVGVSGKADSTNLSIGDRVFVINDSSNPPISAIQSLNGPSVFNNSINFQT